MKNFNNRSNSYFTNSVVVDLVFVLMRIFDSKSPHNLENIYSEDYINLIREEYRFLGEIMASLPNQGMEMLEFILCHNNFNALEEYKKFVASLEDEEFFYLFYGRFIERSLIGLALKDEKALNKLYSSFNDISSSFLALNSLFQNKALFVNEFFSCLERLNTKEFKSKYEQTASKVYDEFDKIDSFLLELEPLEFSQKIMGKTFKNRGPYKKFIFIPSYFICRKAVRFFDEDQILIYSINHSQFNRENAVKILKVISDDKRFEILELLSGNNPLMGKDLAEKLDLTKATISHHIEQLKDIGFINEERVKNSKFYTINSAAVDRFIEYISLKIKKSR